MWPRARRYLQGIEAHGGVSPGGAEVHQQAHQPSQAQDRQQDQHRLHRGPAGQRRGWGRPGARARRPYRVLGRAVPGKHLERAWSCRLGTVAQDLGVAGKLRRPEWQGVGVLELGRWGPRFKSGSSPAWLKGRDWQRSRGRAEAWTVGPGGMDLEGLPLPPPQVPQGATMHFKAPLAWVALPLAEGRVAKRKAWGVGGWPLQQDMVP